jgi:acetolactate synthase-1/2/3 large subunit/5-guanidino-2-oxopentanoate decarboxylase
MDRPLGAQISHMLKARGVEVIFGIPGVHNQELYRGIEAAGLRHVLARHEQGAGFMADGYARATGQPGVCYVITGPGLCNIMTPMGQAYSDSVPMLVISSCLDETAARRGQLHQMLDQEGAARAVCDWSETARTAEAAYQLIDRALTEFGATRARPKHVQVPIAQLVAPASGWREVRAGGTLPSATDAGIAATLALLAGSRRPLFVFGGGAIRASGLARAVVKRAGAASFVTYAGRGIVAPNDPLHFGAMLARPDSTTEIARADLVIAVGTSLDEVDIWRPELGHEATLVRVDIDPEVLVDPQGAELGVLSDASSFLGDLLAALPADGTATYWTPAEVASARARWRAEVDAEYPRVLPVADALRAVLPPDTMIYSDMTQFAYAAKEVWLMDRPGHWHHPFGFGTLGYALPAAIGGKIGRGAAPTIAIAGDYGLQYTLGELAVAVELGLSLPVFIWDNGKLGAIEASMIRAQIAPNAVVQRNPDFGLLARAYGAGYAEPRSLADLPAVVAAALGAQGPTLIRLTPGLAG